VSISITKSAAAVSAALIICMGALTVAGVYTVKKFTDYLPEEKQKIENLHPGSADKTVIPSVPDIFSYNVAVSQVEMDDVSSELLESYRNKMTEELKKIRGTNAAINMEKLDAAHISGKILSITIIKLSGDRKDSDAESSYRISAKIINSSNSQVLMYSSVTADNENAIKDSLSLLAEKISGKL